MHVGGSAEVTDLTRWLDGRLPWVMAFVLVLTFLVMLVSFGSPWLAAVTVGLNLLSVGAAYGVMTAVFQGTWAQGLLGFTSIGVDRRVAAAAHVRAALRPLDGLPRVRGVAGPRGVHGRGGTARTPSGSGSPARPGS